MTTNLTWQMGRAKRGTWFVQVFDGQTEVAFEVFAHKTHAVAYVWDHFGVRVRTDDRQRRQGR